MNLELIFTLASSHPCVLNAVLECQGKLTIWNLMFYHKLLLLLYFIPHDNWWKCFPPTFPWLLILYVTILDAKSWVTFLARIKTWIKESPLGLLSSEQTERRWKLSAFSLLIDLPGGLNETLYEVKAFLLMWCPERRQCYLSGTFADLYLPPNSSELSQIPHLKLPEEGPHKF